MQIWLFVSGITPHFKMFVEHIISSNTRSEGSNWILFTNYYLNFRRVKCDMSKLVGKLLMSRLMWPKQNGYLVSPVFVSARTGSSEKIIKTLLHYPLPKANWPLPGIQTNREWCHQCRKFCATWAKMWTV